VGCKRRPIRRELKYPHLRSASIDHIIPLSLGGDDTAANKRAAHFGCNIARGNKMDAEQVALFGSVREPPLATVTAGERAVMFQRKKRVCACGAVPLEGRKFCQDCLDRRRVLAEDRVALKRSCRIRVYTCRYCGELKVAKGSTQRREVCPARACQLARLAANNLRTRHGLTKEDADAQVARIVASTLKPAYGRWQRGAA
jgi:5-methylcytosine-specific restriction endonuclease McrA